MELTYTVQRSARRRRITITVERDRSVVVHAPADTPDEEIRQVVDAKRQWIYEKTNPEVSRPTPCTGEGTGEWGGGAVFGTSVSD